MTTTGAFGSALRAVRKQKEKTMGDVAEALGVTVSYVSDVELGRRMPLSADKIDIIAKLLEVPAEPLHKAALGARGKVTLLVGGREKAREVGAMLMRGFEHLDDEQLEQIAAILRASEVKDSTEPKE